MYVILNSETPRNDSLYIKRGGSLMIKQSGYLEKLLGFLNNSVQLVAYSNTVAE